MSKIIRQILATYKYPHILVHLLIALLTFLIVMLGYDWNFFVLTRGDTFRTIGMSAGMIGFFVPIFVPMTIYILGLLRKNEELKTVAKKSVQAVIVALVIIAFYKALTGRIQPDFLNDMIGPDASRQFNFGFLKHGIFWGWPSSHAGSSFALATFIALWYRKKKAIVFVAMLYAFYIAFGASVGFHWLSEALSGAILGSLIGYVVYKDTGEVKGVRETKKG